MSKAENLKLLTDERALLEAEAALAREEHALWTRLQTLLADDAERRAHELGARLTALESQPGAPASELLRARTLLREALAEPGPVAANERATALAARRGALQSRELAARAFATGLAQYEALRARRAQVIEAAEAAAQGAELALRQAALERQRQADQAARAAQAAEAARLEAERQAARAIPTPAPTQPAVTTVAPTPPVQPAVAAAKTPAKAPVVRRVSRRRRVKLPPPPGRLEVEVATYGENNFYTGFERKISEGGLFVATLENLPAGHELEVEIDLAGAPIKTRARVEFVRTTNLSNDECTPGAGLRLLELSGAQASAIEAFFARRPPMFVPAVS